MGSRLALAPFLLAFTPGFTAHPGEGSPAPRRPNVVLIVTDDQGHGDLGLHGNPWIRTPHLDGLARAGARLTRFYVSPVCSPTRASLLTGRYNYRTGAIDTSLGRSLMHPGEVTLAEMLSSAGYRTGIFGKWHLGDNYPLRPMDQGFQESLVLKGGGIGQPSDLPGGDSYFDPVLLENGHPVRKRGYVSDVLTEAAMRFVGENAARPFFLYLAFNAPHEPLEVPDRYHALYRGLPLDTGFPQTGNPLPAGIDREVTARVYGMVTNIDDNVGRLLARIDETNLAGDTIVVFLTDNGPQQSRYTSGLRGRKGTVYEGGIRVPAFIRWPGRIPAGTAIDRIAAHLDLVPTLLEACGVERPSGLKLDGVSLLPLLEERKAEWIDRTVFIQWHRGDRPDLERSFAAVRQRWKLVQSLGVEPGPPPSSPRFELFDLEADPFEMRDRAGEEPDIVADLRRGYQAWFRDVSSTRGYDPPRIFIGAPQENPVLLTRQDGRGPEAAWKPEDVPYWEVEVAEAGSYRVTLHFPPSPQATARAALGDLVLEAPVGEGETSAALGPARLSPGPKRLEAALLSGGEKRGPSYLEIYRLER